MSVLEEEIEKRKKEMDLLLAQAQACTNQREQTVNYADKPRLEAQFESLRAQYYKKINEIKWLEAGNRSDMTLELLNSLRSEVHRDWTDGLMWLDYVEPTNHFRNIFNAEDRANSILLFVQRREVMKAELYLKRILKEVQGRRVYRRTEGFTAFGVVDCQWFAQEWRSKLQMPSRENELDVSIREIVEKLQGSVDYGQVLWLEMAFDSVAEDFFSWFLTDFWKPLNSDSSLVEKGITVVAILTLEDTLSDPALLNPFRCTPDNFNTEQYCEIVLANWSQKDIEKWIIRHMNRTLHQRRLPEQDPQSLSARIYNRSHQGEPLSAHDFIRGTLLDKIFHPLGAI